jgi:hypothetical protein
MRVVLVFERAAWSELKHPNLSDIYDYTLGLLACQDGVFPQNENVAEVSTIISNGSFPWPCATVSRLPCAAS